MLSLLTALSLTQPGPCRLREPSFCVGKVGFGFGGRLRLSGLVDSDHSELVPLALAQAWHSRLQLVNSGSAVLVVGDESVEPAAELVFLLDDIMGDGAATVLLRLVPSQRHRLVVEVDNLGFSRGTGRSVGVFCQDRVSGEDRL